MPFWYLLSKNLKIMDLIFMYLNVGLILLLRISPIPNPNPYLWKIKNKKCHPIPNILLFSRPQSLINRANTGRFSSRWVSSHCSVLGKVQQVGVDWYVCVWFIFSTKSKMKRFNPKCRHFIEFKVRGPL